MAVNNFLPFAPTDTGTNLLSQSDYAVAADRTIGNQPGVASSKLVNKAIRQSSYVVSQLAQYLADSTGTDVVDDSTPAKLLAQINAAMTPLAPVVTRYLSGSGNHNKTFVFFIASGSATAGATYTNNGTTYTVKATVASGVQISMTGNGAPTVSGTLTKSGGTGDATLSFYAQRSAICFRVVGVGGGGGGGGAAVSGQSAGGAGGNTTFGTTLLAANGGSGGASGGAAGGGGQASGGTASLGTGPVGLALQGGSGNGGSNQVGTIQAGAPGAASALGGGGGAAHGGANGGAGVTNTGGGGGGAGGNTTFSSGSGGGSGGYVDAVITSPAATYPYAVGTGGTSGGAGGGVAGGGGGSGVLMVIELFQ